MRATSILLVTVCVLVSLVSVALADNILQNTDFKQGTQGWHGDGHAVFLKADGTEGEETDAGVIPVIRISLAKGRPHAVSQEIHSKDANGSLHVSVEVFASPDFKRSTHPDDYATEDVFPMTPTDFMVRFMPDWWEHKSNLRAGQWTTVSTTFSGLTATDDRNIFFVVPPGDGFVYIKNPSLTP